MDFKLRRLGLALLVEILLMTVDASIYVSDPSRTRIVEFQSSNQPCRIISDRESIQNMMRQSNIRQIHMVNTQELNALSNSCMNSNVGSLASGFIYPGTKWCGPGNLASGFSDLGIKSDVDRCCREHDHCPMTLEPGQCRRGICNVSPFTRSHCDCDTAFKKCLREVNNNDARLIATLYFNVAQVTCFKDRRSCPEWMRNDLSYTWFCDEWKFVPVDNYIPPNINEIPDESRRKPQEHSKIDDDLHALYRTDEDIEKIMHNSKSIPKTFNPIILIVLIIVQYLLSE